MALIKTDLASSLFNVFSKRLENINQIGAEIAQAYSLYAAKAQAPAGDPVVLLGIGQQRLASDLSKIMRIRPLKIPAAALVGQAVTSFWLVPPVLSGTGGTCVSIITPPGVNVLAHVKADSINRAASKMADALHMMTKTVFVTYPAGPPGFLI